jgi:hypothetical protein
MAEPAFVARHRDRNGEIGRKQSYGPGFARGCGDHEILGDVLRKLDEPSLTQLIRDHESGRLEKVCQQ